MRSDRDAMLEADHAAWRQRQPWWVAALDVVVAAHWRGHSLGDDDRPPDGNAHLKRWYPRRGVVAYFVAMTVVCWCAAFVLAGMTVPVGGWVGRAGAWVTAHIMSVSPEVRCLALMLVLADVGFAYTNHVTAHRGSWIRGLHGGYRDILLVNGATVVMWWWNVSHVGGRVFAPVPPALVAQAHAWWAQGMRGQLAAIAMASATATPAIQGGGAGGVGMDHLLAPPMLASPPPLLTASTGGDSLGVHDPNESAWARAVWWLLSSVSMWMPAMWSRAVGHGVAQATTWWQWTRSLVDHYLTCHGVLTPAIALYLGFLIGLQAIPYLVRAGWFHTSLSGKDMSESSLPAFLGMLFRVVVILFFATDHAMWMVDNGEWQVRVPVYTLVITTLYITTRALRERYYFHWHHWAAGIMLSPISQSHHAHLSLVLLGLTLGQHVDGAARFSCAPLWHRHPKYTGTGYKYV